MKTIASRSLILFGITTMLFLFSCSSGKQISSSATPIQITQAINNDEWMFSANYALPTYGRSRNVSGNYFVKCNKNELTVDLPYYGRLNSPAGAYSGNPLDFHSTNFKLNKDNLQNGKWTVTIESPNPEVQSMTFTFFDNGTAQLNVVMTSRSGIGFTGKVMPS